MVFKGLFPDVAKSRANLPAVSGGRDERQQLSIYAGLRWFPSSGLGMLPAKLQS
jgi:hypothetical protein